MSIGINNITITSNDNVYNCEYRLLTHQGMELSISKLIKNESGG